MPPPSTPNPKLITRRPRPQGSRPTTSPPRFVAPRAPAHPSTPTPTQLFLPSSARPRYTDDIESSPSSSPVAESDDGLDDGEGQDAGDERERKRRRVSIFSEDEGLGRPRSPSKGLSSGIRGGDQIESSPPVPASEDLGSEDGKVSGSEGENGDEAFKGRAPSEGRISISADSEGNLGAMTEKGEGSKNAILDAEDSTPLQSPTSELLFDTPRANRPNPRQPKFHDPPNFKPPSLEPHVHLEGLPPAFSPQRKGAKYVPGGLAAEVQGRLSHIKGSREAELELSIRVKEVKEDGRMYIVRGRRVGGDGVEDGDGEEGDDGEMRVLLAGEGQKTGLGESARVMEGCVVTAGGLRWDLELVEMGKWIVACDWRVTSESLP